jgi:hypothetical protein
MQLYTREDLLKRAWVADARQADMMIDAIAASYNGDINTFDCLINGVANLHWMSETLKCTDPSSTVTETVQSVEEVSQVTILTFDAYADFNLYEITINQNVEDVLQSVTFSFSTSPGDDINTVLNYFVTEISTNTLISVSAVIGVDDPNTIVLTAGGGYPIFTTTSLLLITAVEEVDGEYIEKIETVETPVGRCLTDENISGIVLRIERMVGSLCGCDPNDLIDDTLPDVVRFTNPILYPIEGGPLQVISIGTIIPPPIVPEPEKVDFNIQDFNPIDFA